MNLGQIARLLSGFILFFTLSLIVPLGVSLGESARTCVPFTVAIAVGLFLATMIVFGRAATFDFVAYDDPRYVWPTTR